VSVQLWRKGSTKDITLVIGEIQDETAVAQRSSRSGSGAAGSSESETRLGLVVSELNDQQKAELQIEGGLIVEDTRGPAARSQLQRGDVILSVGNIEIRSIAQFNEVLKKVPRGHNIALLVRRSEGTVYVSIKMDEK
jgi:serine protease Do